MNIAIARLKELGVEVKQLNDDYDLLLIPHELDPTEYIEIGYLMAQLATEGTFPEHYQPLSSVPSKVAAQALDPSAEFRDSAPAYMKFGVRRLGK